MEDSPGCFLPFLPLGIVAGLIGFFLLIPVQTGPDIIATVGPTFKMAQLDEAEALWNAQDISSYTITLYHGRPVASLEPTLTVINGEVVKNSAVCWQYTMSRADCVPPPFDPAAYTIPGLFDTIRNVLKYSDPAAVKQLEFDQTYGYPTYIDYNDPRIDNEEWWITIESFEVN